MTEKECKQYNIENKDKIKQYRIDNKIIVNKICWTKNACTEDVNYRNEMLIMQHK